MSVAIVRVVLLGSLLLAPGPAFAQQAEQQQRQRPATAIPANITAGLFAPDMEALLRTSDTFRSQCARIAGDARVRVRVSVAYSIDGGGRAQTTFRRYQSGTLSAEVELLFGENYRELLAHEFEHVIEQIDGVNLGAETAAGRAWAVAGGAFETRRALLIGVHVLRETEMAHARAAGAAPPAR